MRFKKTVTIYETKTVKVRINECHAPRRKTRIFAVRKDTKSYIGEYLGSIEWNGAWRQYWFLPDTGTGWASGCMKGITEFLDELNKATRAKWRRR